MKVTFWGAARTVTGSMHEVALNGHRYLLDCGLFQGPRREARARNANLPFEARAMRSVILSHAHIDHSGNLPTLVKNGFAGAIHCTPATAGLCRHMLPDSAYIQQKDAEFLHKRIQRRRRLGEDGSLEVVEPLYSIADAEGVMPLLTPAPLGQRVEAGPGLFYSGHEAGHLLGSMSVYMELEEKGRRRRLGFSGDVGRVLLPILKDPEPLPPVDYLILESTYGDRLHKDVGDVSAKLAEAINRVCARGGRIIAPAFAVGRTQQLVVLLHELMKQERIPGIPIFVDSPLAIAVTEVFREHAGDYDSETYGFVQNGEDPFCFGRLRYVREVADSKAINDLRGPLMVISASGMAEFGRVLHHLRNSIEDPRNMVLITGFQAAHTLGRRLVEKQREVPIFGEPVRLRAEVVKLNELSGHADQRELLAWMKPLAPTLKRVFLVHGEESQAAALASAITTSYGIPAHAPKRGESVELD